MQTLELVSHPLCPYVQRAAITLAEKNTRFTRSYVDLSDKPAWFQAISPLGRVPLLKTESGVLFESAAICDYLDETIEPRLHPVDPVLRAQHRAWIAFASSVLKSIGSLYDAPTEAAFKARALELRSKFERVEAALGPGPFFGGEAFSLVDAAFAPVFRYFDVLESFVQLGAFSGLSRVNDWRRALTARSSVRDAVGPDYGARLEAFLRGRDSHLSRLLEGAGAARSQVQAVPPCRLKA